MIALRFADRDRPRLVDLLGRVLYQELELGGDALDEGASGRVFDACRPRCIELLTPIAITGGPSARWLRPPCPPR
jgi:hypothetical protein